MVVGITAFSLWSLWAELFFSARSAKVIRILAAPDGYGLDAVTGLGVVVPHRAQRAALQQAFPELCIIHPVSGLPVRSAIDTVERFQGGERDIMILSFARSHGTGFVFDDRRLNVAMTRARRKLVLVAHPQLFQKSRYAWICTFTETLKTAGTT